MANLLLAVIYLAFISLGLPDGLLGAAWPVMSQDLHAPLSAAGGIAMVVSAGTICSALLSDRLTLRFGAGKVTATSVAITALALFGFSLASQYWMLLVLAIPYGLGAGGVDAALNNYVALHYTSRHMSWLHCMWGIGALTGPYIMGFALAQHHGWQAGYRIIGIIQVVLTAVLIFSLPLWRTRTTDQSSTHVEVLADGNGEVEEAPRQALSLIDVLRIAGAPQILLMFFCYCAIEQTTILWSSSYMVAMDRIPETQAAQLASLVFIGITVGRFISGWMTMRFTDPTMIRMGAVLIVIGIMVLFLPLPGVVGSVIGFIVIGLGCAPIYPCVIHSTPAYFGQSRSQAIIGVQMACAYIGSMLMPPLFGVIAQHTTLALLPWYLLVLIVVLYVMHEWLGRAVRARKDNGLHTA